MNCSWSAWTPLFPGRTWRTAFALSTRSPDGDAIPTRLSSMLRVYCVQLFYNLSDPGMEDLLYESDQVRRFTGLSSPAPARRDHHP